MTMTPEFRGAVEGFRREAARVGRQVDHPAYVVNALGRDFRVTEEMVTIFLRQVERVLESDASALVVLRHEHGVELLMVTDDNSFSVRLADDSATTDVTASE